jgi:DNA-directed RNA polymerase specialized sigma24 family protein
LLRLLADGRLEERLVWFFARRGCLDPENCAAETVQRALAKLRSGEEIGTLVGLIWGVADNVAKEARRKDRRVAASEPADAIPDMGPASGPEHALLLKEIHGMVKRLPNKDRELLTSYFGRRDHANLARELGITANALRIRVHRIVGRLRLLVSK